MRAPRTLAGLVLALSATGLSGGAASAAPTGDAELFPTPARPGDAVAVSTSFCTGDTTATGDATSVGAGEFTLAPSTQTDALIGQFTVPAGATAGNYTIAVSCASGGRLAGGVLRVVQAASTASPTATPTTTATPTPTATTPSGSVQGGIGGSVGGTGALVAGTGALLVASAAGGVWMMRRRYGGRHTSDH